MYLVKGGHCDIIINKKGLVSLMSNFNFDAEFMTDDEINEALDSLVAAAAESIEMEDNKTALVNPFRIRDVRLTYEVLKRITKGTGAKVTYELNQPYKSMGSVSVVGRNIMFNNVAWFLKAIELSSNLDIYPKTDGTVQMDFTFHGLTKTIE